MDRRLALLLLLVSPLAALPAPPPASAETAVVVAHPGAFLYESPFGAEIAEIPSGTELEVLGAERLFTRVRHAGRAGYVGNAQIASPAALARLDKEAVPRPGERAARVRAARPVPLHETPGGTVLRRMEPGTRVAIEGEDDRHYRVRFLDARGYALKADLAPIRPGEPANFRIEAERPAVEEIDFRLGTEENPIHAFVAAVGRFFARPVADPAFARKLSYAEPTATPGDLRDFLARIGVPAELTGHSAPFSGILADFRRGALLLFRLRVDGRFRHLLLTMADPPLLKFLDILERRGHQFPVHEFALMLADSPIHLRILPPDGAKPPAAPETSVKPK